MSEALRVRLATRPDTAPGLLAALARDPAVTVRASLAINAAAPAQVDRCLAADRDERVRSLLARKLSSFVPGASAGQRAALQDHALGMLMSLVQDEAVRVRLAIADIVKEMPEAPRELILRLAWDSAVPVSEPVIRLSPLLTAEDLIALLSGAPSSATATAVARRPGLTAPVSDAIVATADSAAIRALLENHSAAIREATLDALIGRAAANTEWHEPLVRRPALSARAANALAEIVTTHLLSILASRGDLDDDVTAQLQRRLRERLEPPNRNAPELNRDDALAEARRLRHEDKLNEAALMEAAQVGEVRLCTAMLATAAEVPLPVVERAATLRSAKALVSLVWRAGFSMAAAGPVQTLLGGISPTTALRDDGSGRFPLAVDEMRWQVEFLERACR